MPAEAAWQALEAALDARAGRPVRFWWRDDDATTATPALDRLLQVTAGRPLALAVIPATADAALAARLASVPEVTVLQHGWMHASHAPEGERKAEFGAHRPMTAMLGEVERGRARLAALFGRRFLPVFVPPWNRMTPDLLPHLAAQGFAGWSADRAREPAPILRGIHAGFDPVDKRHPGGFGGETLVLPALLAALAAAGTEPFGLLTHHLVIGESGWRFLERLSALFSGHPSVAWLGAGALFGAEGQG